MSLSGCSNKAVWSAMVRTQDLTPPVLTVVDTPPPDFDKISVLVQLDEPGTIYGGLLLSANQQQVSASVACEPVFTVSVMKHNPGLMQAAAAAVPGSCGPVNIVTSARLLMS